MESKDIIYIYNLYKYIIYKYLNNIYIDIFSEHIIFK